MLQAFMKNGRSLTLASLNWRQIQEARKQQFYCPDCKEQVVIRAGEKVIPHFAHQKSSNCTANSGESHYHRQGKLHLYRWLLNQNIRVELEKYFPEIKQRPDLFLKIRSKKIVIEFQCATVPINEIRKRNKGYHHLDITPIWILGAKRFQRIGRHKLKIDHFTKQFLQQYSPETPSFLLFFCPTTNTFSKISDPYFTNKQQALAYMSFHKATRISFPQLFHHSHLPSKTLYRAWLHEKSKFRLTKRHFQGHEQPFRNWLYEKGLFVEHLPATIHLPTPYEKQIKLANWIWQSYFMMEFLHPLPIGAIFSTKQVSAFLQCYLQIDVTQTMIGQAYLTLLVQLGILEKRDRFHYQKIRIIRFYTHLNDALKGDAAVMNKLLSLH